MFNVGDKVVCIASEGECGISMTDWLQFEIIGFHACKGKTYVVRGTLNCSNGLGLQLIGSQVIHVPSGAETGWNATAFRKLDELQAEARQRKAQEQEKPDWQ